jgi:hypothetical protein
MNQPFISVPVREAARTDPVVRHMAALLASGEVSVCAPFEGMGRAWTADEKASLDKALAEVFGWSAATRAPEYQS